MASWHKTKVAIGILLLIFLLSACSREKENLLPIATYAKWNKPLGVADSIVAAFDDADDLIWISSGTVICAHKNWLFIEDYKTVDNIIHVVDVSQDRYIGSFGNFGAGPGEVLRPGSLFILPDDKLALFDYGQWCVKSFDIDSALSYKDYIPHTVIKLSEQEVKSGFPDRFVSVRGSQGIGRLVKLEGAGSYTQSLCSYDVATGNLEPFGVQDNLSGFKSSVAVSEADNLVVEVSSNQDVIRLYDLEGSLTREIRGPKYEERPSKELAFYSKAVIGDGKIFAVYSGENRIPDFCGKQIVVFSLDGEYLHSYLLNDRITDMTYSDDYNRLYFATDGDMQFGYLQIGNGDSAPNGNKPWHNKSDDNATADDELGTVRNDSRPPLTLIDPDDKLQITPVYEARVRPYKASDAADVSYFIPIFNQSDGDTIRIDSIRADIPCVITKVPDFALIPRLLVSVIVTPTGKTQQAEDRNVTFTVYYGNKKQLLHAKLLKN